MALGSDHSPDIDGFKRQLRYFIASIESALDSGNIVALRDLQPLKPTLNTLVTLIEELEVEQWLSEQSRDQE
jgi:hypothetical protein